MYIYNHNTNSTNNNDTNINKHNNEHNMNNAVISQSVVCLSCSVVLDIISSVLLLRKPVSVKKTLLRLSSAKNVRKIGNPRKYTEMISKDVSTTSKPKTCYIHQDMWENKLSGHQMRGWRAVAAEGLQGKGLKLIL